MQHARGVVLGVAASEGGVGKDAGAQAIAGVEVGAADAFIDHILQCALRTKAAFLSPFDEYIDDAGVLADRAVALGAHAAVGQDLRDGILGSGALFGLIGLAQRADIVHRMEIADVLQRVGDAFNQVILGDCHHIGHFSSS